VGSVCEVQLVTVLGVGMGVRVIRRVLVLRGGCKVV